MPGIRRDLLVRCRARPEPNSRLARSNPGDPTGAT